MKLSKFIAQLQKLSKDKGKPWFIVKEFILF